MLLDSSSASQYGSVARTSVASLFTGRSYAVASSCYPLLGGFCATVINTRAPAAFVNRGGQAAAAIVSEGSQTTAIAGFTSRGTKLDLDAGPSSELPSASLRLRGSEVSWTHSGQPRSAHLSG